MDDHQKDYSERYRVKQGILIDLISDMRSQNFSL